MSWWQTRRSFLPLPTGRKAIARSSLARFAIIIAGFLNADAVADAASKQAEGEVIMVCAGWKGRLSLEDPCCSAGYIVNSFYDGQLPETAKDGAKVAMGLFERFSDALVRAVVAATNHAKRLQEMGYAEKIIGYCCALNTVNIVPESCRRRYKDLICREKKITPDSTPRVVRAEGCFRPEGGNYRHPAHGGCGAYCH